ncbi:cytochrome P450 [Phanerochaete sordida]|uniref:Cytochrome P450 n=1 Tax=Phanerochaete sordida TaxID=48140 RepID=A0A9P3GQX3_9APHY|nr:cytochrome P450 [Phanerochaete sordida]
MRYINSAQGQTLYVPPSFCPSTMSFASTFDSFSLRDITKLLTYLTSGVVLSLLLQSFSSAFRLRHIPTESSSCLPLLSSKGAYFFLRDIKGVFQRGYDKHKGKLFKVSFPDRWVVVVTGRKLLEELQRLPDGTTSFMHAAGELTGTPYIFGNGMVEDPWHVPIIRDKLTKHLSAAFPDIYDEIDTSFKELMPKCEDWTPVHALQVARGVVARASNRVFVGLPLCRNQGYLSLLVRFAVDVGRTRNVLAWFPSALKGIVAKMVTQVEPRIKEGMQYLGPVIQQRTDDAQAFGDGWAKPDDMLQWIMDAVAARNGPHEDILRGIFLINFAAIHTSSNTFTHALYHLAANPEFIGPLREEVDAVVAEDGWTKAAMGKLWKLDSFMRESLRHNSTNPFSVRRMALKNFTFSDGTVIPQGTVVVTPPYATHFDEENYQDAAVFNPWRHVNEKKQDGDASRHQFITTSTTYVAWGHGKHACPGRFFAANELKIMMAYVIASYDVKFEREGVRPKNVHVALTISPDPEARVLFKERKSARI